MIFLSSISHSNTTLVKVKFQSCHSIWPSKYVIQIQHLLKLNYERASNLEAEMNSNTTLVKVKSSAVQSALNDNAEFKYNTC